MHRTILFLGVLLLLPATAPARIWTILPDGTGDEPTIQAGINAAAHHDTILAEPGTYFEHIDFEGKKVAVGSRFMVDGDTTWIGETTIDGNYTYGSVVTFHNQEESLSILCGLTITHGSGTAYGYVFGAGIFIHSASPTLHHLVIRENGSGSSDLIGGGIAVLGGSPLIAHVRIEDNQAGYYCGGFACSGDDCRPILRKCVITANWGDGSSAIDVDAGAHARLENVVITGNLGSHGNTSVLCLAHSRLDLINVTLADNDNLKLGLSSGALVVLVNTILWDNNTPEISFYEYGPDCALVVSHCTIAGGLEGIETNAHGTVEWLEGNLDEDPLFQDAGAGDYTLVPGSPCIDAGTAFFVWDGQVLVNLDPEDYCGDAPDMGALEYCPDPAAAEGPRVPARAELLVCPNPAVVGATISFARPEPERVRVSIFDLGGRMVARITDDWYGRGAHSIRWDGRDLTGRRLPSGSYVARLEAGGRSEARILQLLR